MTPQELWDQFGCDAEWERVDRVDDYCWDCIISLEVDGHKFSGSGYECCEDREITSLECELPDGTVIDIEY